MINKHTRTEGEIKESRKQRENKLIKWKIEINEVKEWNVLFRHVRKISKSEN